jgi:iron only hydrogenase large subunit-like protein
MYPDKEINVVSAEGLAECRKMMMVAKAGKYDGFLLEGMACPGGCIAGAGTIQPIAKSAASVALHKKVSTNAHAYQSDYRELLDILEENDLKKDPE